MLRIIQEALTFDDVLLVPGHSTVLPHTADLRTRLTRDVTLNIPMVSAAMDTVSEAPLAIALAQEGGIGFIHKNMKPEEQAKHVRAVKKYESGVVSDPVTVTKDATIGDVIALSKRLGYSGFPVTDADSLDYHIGAPLAWYESQSFVYFENWLMIRQYGSGEILNFLGVVNGIDNLNSCLNFIFLIFLLAATPPATTNFF